MRSCEIPRKRKDLRSQLTMALLVCSFPDDGPRPGSGRRSSTVYCTGNCVQYYLHTGGRFIPLTSWNRQGDNPERRADIGKD